METKPDDFDQVFSKTISFIEKIKSKPVELKSQEAIGLVCGKIHNLTIWLSGKCDLMYLDFAEEVESIMYLMYGDETIKEYNECVNEICNPIDLEKLNDMGIENLIGSDVDTNKSIGYVEELIGGQNKNKQYLLIDLAVMFFFSIVFIFSTYYLYLIGSGQETPIIGQTVYTMGTKHSRPKPYVITSEYDIYEYVILRLICAIIYVGLSIFTIKISSESIEQNIGKISFVKLLKLSFDEQNQVVKYIVDKIEGTNKTNQIKQSSTSSSSNVIEIPELKKIKAPTKPKLSIINPDIFIESNDVYMTSKAVKLSGLNFTGFKKIQEHNQKMIEEAKENKEKKNLVNLMSKCVPSIFKRIIKSKK